MTKASAKRLEMVLMVTRNDGDVPDTLHDEIRAFLSEKGYGIEASSHYSTNWGDRFVGKFEREDER